MAEGWGKEVAREVTKGDRLFSNLQGYYDL